MVKRLDNRLSARAEPAAADRVERIAFYLFNSRYALPDRFTFELDNPLATHYAYERAATGRAFRADSRVPALFSDRDIVLGNQERNQGVRLAAATGRGGPRRGGSYDFEEVSTVHG